MTQEQAHRAFKTRFYEQLARVGKAVSSPHRLELLELLTQCERSVDSLATETGLSIANTSQHLQALRGAGLVEGRRDGMFVYYRLADDEVFQLSRVLRSVAERRLAELDRLVRDHFSERADDEAVDIEELLARAGSGKIVILDARPAAEYDAGHIAGAISVPVDELQEHLQKLPKNKQYVAYCRGPYCIYADRAVEMLRTSGRKAKRLTEGFPEWRAAGHPVERSNIAIASHP